MERIEKILLYRKSESTVTPTNNAVPFEFRLDDIIISGHPKSGTTWMQQILHQIRTKGDESFEEIYKVVPYLPTYSQKTDFNPKADQIAEPRLFKLHSLYESVSHLYGETRFVLTIRDPYDAEFSLMKFLFRFMGVDRDMEPKEYEEAVSGRNSHDYASFITSWWPHRHDPNVLLVPYEDLKKNLAACIQKIAAFAIGEPLKKADFAKVVHFCSFDYMSQNPEKFCGDDVARFISERAKIDYRPVIGGMVRLDGGQVGQGWKMLDEKVRSQIDKRWKETVENKLGFKCYKELYEECTHFGDDMELNEE